MNNDPNHISDSIVHVDYATSTAGQPSGPMRPKQALLHLILVATMVLTLASLWIVMRLVANPGHVHFIFNLKMIDLFEVHTEVEKTPQ